MVPIKHVAASGPCFEKAPNACSIFRQWAEYAAHVLFERRAFRMKKWPNYSIFKETAESSEDATLGHGSECDSIAS